MSTTAYLIAGTPPILSSKEPTAASSTSCTLEYLNEGGANFVFRISPTGKEPLLTNVQGKLLRLHKNFSHLQPTLSQLHEYEQNFATRFPPQHLIEHTLIRLTDDISSMLNKVLGELSRPAHRTQDFLPLDELHGLLVTDMTPQNDDILLQLKPKWLSQSPNAPARARRCRTCALRAQRASKQIRTATDAQESCPLDLVSDDSIERQGAARAVSSNEMLSGYLVHQAQPLLLALKAYQQELDLRGCLGVSPLDRASIFNICKAMTLRDCTLFLKQSGKTIEARLGDLDLKQPEKLSKWQEVEQSLISEGWYADHEGPLRHPERICKLSRTSVS